MIGDECLITDSNQYGIIVGYIAVDSYAFAIVKVGSRLKQIDIDYIKVV